MDTEDEVVADTVASAAAAAARSWDLSTWTVVIVIGALTLALLVYGWRYFASSNKQRAALDQLLADVSESEGTTQSAYPWDTWQWEWQTIYRELDSETTSESRRRVVLVSRASECISNARAFDAAKVVRRTLLKQLGVSLSFYLFMRFPLCHLQYYALCGLRTAARGSPCWGRKARDICRPRVRRGRT
jgi:hypothetical protein